jgi:hypothetical protein
VTSGAHAKSELHQTAVGSRCESYPAGHLDLAWPGSGRAISEQVADASAFDHAIRGKFVGLIRFHAPDQTRQPAGGSRPGAARPGWPAADRRRPVCTGHAHRQPAVWSERSTAPVAGRATAGQLDHQACNHLNRHARHPTPANHSGPLHPKIVPSGIHNYARGR